MVHASKIATLIGKRFCGDHPNLCGTHTNWKPFYHSNNVIVSYEYDNEISANGQQGSKLHVSKNSDGYIYFFVKKETPKETRNRRPEAPTGRFETDEDESNYMQAFNLMGVEYMILFDKIDCKREVLSEVEAYYPKDGDYGSYKPLTEYAFALSKKIKLDGHGQYGEVPFRAACESFSQVWKDEKKKEEDLARQQIEKESAIAEQKAIEKFRLEKEQEDQKAEAKRKLDEHIKQLKQYGVQYIVNPIAIEADPFKYEGKVISCKLHFERMMSATTASFTSGNSDVAGSTHVVDQIIVSGIPRDTHFAVDILGGLLYELILRGKGTTTGTNAFGANVSVPHFQYVGVIK